MSGVSPRYLSATGFQLTNYSHCRHSPVWATTLSSLRTQPVGEAFQLLWGHHDICPILEQFNVASVTQPELSSLTSLKAWGNLEKFWSNISFLLILTKECTVGDRVYGLSTMWVNSYQARVSTVEEAIKQLTPLISTGPDWPFALVQLNADACHVPLPKEGHLSILVEGSTSSVTCRRISQLEVCQLLSLGSKPIYPAGLNGCEVPMITSLPKSLAKGATMLGGEPIYLPVDILQSATEGQESKPCPLVFTLFPSRLLALSGLLHPRWKGRSAWPQKWGSSYPGQY